MTTITSRISSSVPKSAVPKHARDHKIAKTVHVSKAALFWTLFGLGILGILTIWWQPLTLPKSLNVPIFAAVLHHYAIALRLASMLLSTILLSLLILVGVNTAPRVGLRTPTIEALVTGEPIWAAFKSEIIPGLVGGLLAASILGLYGWVQLIVAPRLLAVGADTPLLVRVFYGGITEELIVRWGLMSLFVWVGWRLIQRRQGMPRSRIVWSGILLAALLSGLLHLPAAFLEGITRPFWMVLIVGANMLVGLVYGWLYWRRGLEAAMIAHVATHVIAVFVLLPLLMNLL